MSKGTLLLADDSITIQKVVNLTFADEGIDVVAVGDGDTAAARLADVKPDIVLADVNMPGLTGYQICEMIRQNESTKDLPVVLLVGSFEPFDEAEAHRVGASSYMTKPFQSIRQLVSQVTDLMEAKSGVPDVVIPVAETPAAVEVADHPVLEETPAATDIESLYQSSFESDQAEEIPEVTKSEYVEAGMDDEMILTTYADETPAESVQDVVEEAEPFVLETDAPSADSHNGQETIPSFGAGSAAAVTAFDDFAETVPIETEEVLAIDEQASVQDAETTPDAADAVHAAETRASEPDNVVEMPAVATAAAFRNDFDEVDLLEIPGIESGRSVEFATEQTAATGGNTTQVVSLSPELMEIIVQKVVEKLSEKY